MGVLYCDLPLGPSKGHSEVCCPNQSRHIVPCVLRRSIRYIRFPTDRHLSARGETGRRSLRCHPSEGDITKTSLSREESIVGQVWFVLPDSGKRAKINFFDFSIYEPALLLKQVHCTQDGLIPLSRGTSLLGPLRSARHRQLTLAPHGTAHAAADRTTHAGGSIES